MMDYLGTISNIPSYTPPGVNLDDLGNPEQIARYGAEVALTTWQAVPPELKDQMLTAAQTVLSNAAAISEKVGDALDAVESIPVAGQIAGIFLLAVTNAIDLHKQLQDWARLVAVDHRDSSVFAQVDAFELEPWKLAHRSFDDPTWPVKPGKVWYARPIFSDPRLADYAMDARLPDRSGWCGQGVKLWTRQGGGRWYGGQFSPRRKSEAGMRCRQKYFVSALCTPAWCPQNPARPSPSFVMMGPPKVFNACAAAQLSMLSSPIINMRTDGRMVQRIYKRSARIAQQLAQPGAYKVMPQAVLRDAEGNPVHSTIGIGVTDGFESDPHKYRWVANGLVKNPSMPGGPDPSELVLDTGVGLYPVSWISAALTNCEAFMTMRRAAIARGMPEGLEMGDIPEPLVRIAIQQVDSTPGFATGFQNGEKIPKLKVKDLESIGAEQAQKAGLDIDAATQALNEMEEAEAAEKLKSTAIGIGSVAAVGLGAYTLLRRVNK